MAKPKVFIAYSHPDADWARSFAKALKQRDVYVWFDEFDVAPGDSMRDALDSALRDSDIVVAVLAAASSNRPALFFELGAAIGMKKRLVPVVPKELSLDTLPFDLRLRKWVVKQTPEETADELSQTLSAA